VSSVSLGVQHLGCNNLNAGRYHFADSVSRPLSGFIACVCHNLPMVIDLYLYIMW